MCVCVWQPTTTKRVLRRPRSITFYCQWSEQRRMYYPFPFPSYHIQLYIAAAATAKRHICTVLAMVELDLDRKCVCAVCIGWELCVCLFCSSLIIIMAVATVCAQKKRPRTIWRALLGIQFEYHHPPHTNWHAHTYAFWHIEFWMAAYSWLYLVCWEWYEYDWVWVDSLSMIWHSTIYYT